MRISQKIQERFLASLTWFFSFITLGVLVYLVGFILFNGIKELKPSLFSLQYTSENVSLFPALISTLIMSCVSLVIAIPLGVSSAVYLVEYAKQSSRFVHLIRLTTETLSSLPSIVYGLFGLLFFSTFLGWGFSVLAGAFTLSMMILPLIIRSSEEALLAVPQSYREGAYGLGAGKIRTIFVVLLPSSSQGILSGIILSIGRIVGETAALIYTAGTVAQIPTSFFDSARTLSVHMYSLSSEGLHTQESYATAAVLLGIVLLINYISRKSVSKLGGKR